ncbi:unnamed protein product [Pedinophyceae sp. YPF-701]|nr:unnamed protein product [Pedinophyceae sp. YPF-701]
MFSFSATTLAVAAAVALFVYGLRIPQRWKLRGIKGPRSDWLAGHLLKSKKAGNLTDYLAAQKDKFPGIFSMLLGARPVVVVQDAKLVRQILQGAPDRGDLARENTSMHADAWNQKMNDSALFFAKGAKAKALRTAWHGAVGTPEAIAGAAADLRAASVTLARRLAYAADTGETVDMLALGKEMSFQVVGSYGLGIKYDPITGHNAETANVVLNAGTEVLARATPDANPFAAFNVLFGDIPGARGALKFLARVLPLRDYAAFRARDREFSTEVKRLMEDAKGGDPLPAATIDMDDDEMPSAQDAEDFSECPFLSQSSFLTTMLAARVPHNEFNTSARRLKDYELVAQGRLFMVAGFETTAVTVAYMAALLAQHPDVQERCIAEIDAHIARNGHPETPDDAPEEAFPVLTSVIKETLRLYPPGPYLLREMKKDVTLSTGQVVREGTNVFIDVYSIQRDSQYWPHPLAFKPDRWIEGRGRPSVREAYMPFGVGARICSGAEFAQVELRMAFIEALSSFRFVAPEPGFTIPHHGNGLTLHPTGPVSLNVSERVPAGAAEPGPSAVVSPTGAVPTRRRLGATPVPRWQGPARRSMAGARIRHVAGARRAAAARVAAPRMALGL